MKNIYLILLFCAICNIVNCQTFIPPTFPPGNCMKDPYNEVSTLRDDIRRSVFIYSGKGAGACTGTFINRNTNEQNLGTFFVTSWHCFKSGKTCGGSEFDWNQDITFKFNYQSPPNQLGRVLREQQTDSIYNITRRVRLVAKVDCPYGDFALCEILGQSIPPNFLPYYAGWSPNVTAGSALSFAVIADDFIDFSHHNSSIKQVATTIFLRDGLTANVAQYSCKTITKVVDLLVGWFWGRGFSTQTLCEYLQIPYVDTRFIIGNWDKGNLAGGSSGSALFNGNNRILGTYSGSGNYPCNLGNFWFRRLPSYYNRNSIKTTLNPPGKWYVDEVGIQGRNTNCAEVIDYNYGKNYDLYPANLFQAQNSIVLNSRTDIFLGRGINNALNIKPEADYTFNAGNSVVLGPGFTAEAGSTFVAKSGNNCSPISAYRKFSEENLTEYDIEAKKMLYAKMNSIELPNRLDLSCDFPTKEMAISISKPCKRLYEHVYCLHPYNNLNVALIDCMGKQVYKNNFITGRGAEIEIPISGIVNGVYQVLLESGENRSVQKFVIYRISEYHNSIYLTIHSNIGLNG